MSFKRFFEQFFIFVITPSITFIMGLLLGLFIISMNKFLNLMFIPKELILLIWSLGYGLSIYSFIFRLNASGKHELQKKMSFFTLTYGIGTYVTLFIGESPISANIFAAAAILGLLTVLTAPPFIEKVLKHKFIQRGN